MEDSPGRTRALPVFLDKTVALLAIAMSCYHLYTAIFGTPEWMIHRPLHVTFVLVMGFLLYKGFRRDNKVLFGIDILLALISLGVFLYIMMDFQRVVTRVPLMDKMLPLDYFFGIAVMVLIMELTRRTTGWPIILVSLFFMANALYGRYFPGFLKNPGVSWRVFVDHMFFTSDGTFGSPVSVSASYVFLFVLFGVFLETTGVGEYFIGLATGITSKLRGGTAKSAIVASGLFGSISGSAVANVYATGTFTIPLMKRSGFKPHFAGAVESVASSGGAIMPPVMGSAAFLMADFIGRPYAEIMKAALIPAILYYLSLWFMVDIESKNTDLVEIKADERNPDVKYYLRKFYLFFPILCIIVLMVLGYTAFYAAFFAILSTLMVGFINDPSSIRPRNIIKALEKGGKMAITIASPLACASLVVGCISLTGVGLKLTSLIMDLSGGVMPIALFLTMVITIILGMGLPTAAAYLIIAIFAPTALTQFGVPVLTAHLFCFYYAAFSTITPPVAMAAYAGGVLAGAPINKTAFTAMKLGIAAYIIPWFFVYSNSLLFEGSALSIITAILTGVVGVYALASGTQGYYLDKKMNILFRVLLIVASLAMIRPGMVTDLIGAVILVTIYLCERLKERKEEKIKAKLS